MKRQDIAVGGILKIADKVLVIRRAPNELSSAGYWEVPKGKVEFGEDPKAALKREYKEEVNLDIELDKPVFITSHTYSRDGIDVHFWDIEYIVHLATGESLDNIRLSEDHDRWMLTSKHDLEKLEPMYDDRKKNLISLFK